MRRVRPPAAVVSEVPRAPLVGPQAVVDARALAAEADFTVLVFFSPDCHCLARHEPRLASFRDAYAPRGVAFFMVDSEVRGTLERDAAEARRRGYPFPILLDRGAHLADAVGADYASYTVVVDRSGRIRYRGGIDSDRTHLHDDATPYLTNALDDLLAARPLRLPSGEALGCALQKW